MELPHRAELKHDSSALPPHPSLHLLTPSGNHMHSQVIGRAIRQSVHMDINPPRKDPADDLVYRLHHHVNKNLDENLFKTQFINKNSKHNNWQNKHDSKHYVYSDRFRASQQPLYSKRPKTIKYYR
jgi:hypothetical protein